MTVAAMPRGIPAPVLALIGVGLGRTGTRSLHAATDWRSLGVGH